jgi:hypothetical protein
LIARKIPTLAFSPYESPKASERCGCTNFYKWVIEIGLYPHENKKAQPIAVGPGNAAAEVV